MLNCSDYSCKDLTFSANLEVKSKAPNGVTFNVKGKSAHEGNIAGSVRPQHMSKDQR